MASKYRNDNLISRRNASIEKSFAKKTDSLDEFVEIVAKKQIKSIELEPIINIGGYLVPEIPKLHYLNQDYLTRFSAKTTLGMGVRFDKLHAREYFYVNSINSPIAQDREKILSKRLILTTNKEQELLREVLPGVNLTLQIKNKRMEFCDILKEYDDTNRILSDKNLLRYSERIMKEQPLGSIIHLAKTGMAEYITPFKETYNKDDLPLAVISSIRRCYRKERQKSLTMEAQATLMSDPEHPYLKEISEKIEILEKRFGRYL